MTNLDESASKEKFGIGKRVPRKEDFTLVQGQGRYAADVSFPDQLHAVMVRSMHAHGKILGIDVETAKTMPGVRAVYTQADLAHMGMGINRMAVKNRDGNVYVAPPRTPLCVDRVRYVGEVIACVVADTRFQARDAAEAVFVDIEALPALTDPRAAAEPDAIQIHDGTANNTVIDFHFGDAEAVAKAFAGAAHVVRQRILSNRVAVAPMEPRSATAVYEPNSERWTLYTPSQGVFGMRDSFARDVLKTTPEKVHIVTGSVGGSFGMKGQVYQEQVCILHAARALGRPVKWTDDRSESFLSDNAGRGAEMVAELALDAEGHFLAVRLTGFNDLGAYLAAPQIGTMNAVKNLVGTYGTKLVEISTKAVLTNTTPVGSYRGAGRPEANYYMGRLVDLAAKQLGLDPVEIRKRNLIPRAAIPYKTPTEMVYDSGDFPALLDKALKLADWAGYEPRRKASEAKGLLRGRGISSYLEATGPISKEMGGIRFEADGSVTMITGSMDYGQGHASPFAQILVEQLGIPFDRIRLIQGDSDQLIAGGGSGGSKSLMSSGTALMTACTDVIERGRQIAAHVLEAAAVDIDFKAGRFAIKGTDRGVGIMDLAKQLREGVDLPGDAPQTLDTAQVVTTPQSSFPNGCHVVEVEVDPQTGVVALAKYTMVNDFGIVVNPLVVEGQAHGGVMQGIGQALMEQTVYDEAGQPLTGSFTDYAMPRADHGVDMLVDFLPTPATTNVLGVKGCGEAGCAGALPAVMGAVNDALSVFGIRHIDMPATPHRVWQAIKEAKAGRAA